jgi:hypothetical protein
MVAYGMLRQPAASIHTAYRREAATARTLRIAWVEAAFTAMAADRLSAVIVERNLAAEHG